MYSSCFTLSSTNTPTHARPNHWCRQEFGGEGVFVAQQRRVCAGGGGGQRAIDLPACRLRELLPFDSTDEEKKISSGRPTGFTEHYTSTYTSERASKQAREAWRVEMVYVPGRTGCSVYLSKRGPSFFIQEKHPARNVDPRQNSCVDARFSRRVTTDSP